MTDVSDKKEQKEGEEKIMKSNFVLFRLADDGAIYFADLQAGTVERREPAHQHEIHALVTLGLLHHQQIGRHFDHA